MQTISNKSQPLVKREVNRNDVKLECLEIIYYLGRTMAVHVIVS